MKSRNGKILNLILAFGLLCIFIGVLILVCLTGTSGKFSTSIFLILVCLAGLSFLYIYIGFSRIPFYFFIGLDFTACGLFWFIIKRNIIPASPEQLWPFLMIITGVCLFVTGRTKKQHIVLYYDLPAVFLVILGIIFLLFSFDIITASFSVISLVACPVILIVAGIFLVILFLKRKALLEILPDEISDGLSENSDFADISNN
ncbi:MAG: hypothetical protein K2M50_02740 [Treponemataceae bacterium]|nr:hypothetical protein [Treponemataceae bacterium]